MKPVRDPSAKHELLEILRREGVGFKFTLIDAARWLPHYTQGNIAGVLTYLRKEHGALKVYDKVPHPDPAKRKARPKFLITRYQVLGAIRKEIRTHGSVKFGERHRTPKDKIERPHTDRFFRGGEAMKEMLEALVELENSCRVVRDKAMKLGSVATEPTDLDLLPEAKLASSLRRRGWTLMEPKGYFAKQAELARASNGTSGLASFMLKQLGTSENATRQSELAAVE